MNVLQCTPGTMAYRKVTKVAKKFFKNSFSNERNSLYLIVLNLSIRSLENIVLHLNPGTKHVLHPHKDGIHTSASFYIDNHKNKRASVTVQYIGNIR